MVLNFWVLHRLDSPSGAAAGLAPLEVWRRGPIMFIKHEKSSKDWSDVLVAVQTELRVLACKKFTLTRRILGPLIPILFEYWITRFKVQAPRR